MTDARPVVFLGMPCHGQMTPGAANGLHNASRGHVNVKHTCCGQNSLTPNAFNDLFALALEMRDHSDVTHFAMIHSDVEPTLFWLDELWAEMVSSQAMLVSAVVPIKEDVSDPFTSTAVGLADDPWVVTRRLRVSDRAGLPDTFGPEHVCSDGEVLLVNTGLWLTDLRHKAWDDFPGFRIRNRITRHEGRRRAECRSEDWEMSRFLATYDARVMATWRIDLLHQGAKNWSNRSPQSVPVT